MAARTCLLCGNDYRDIGFVKCQTCTFETCGVCLVSAKYDCSQCRGHFSREAEIHMTTEQFAMTTKACFDYGEIAGGETGLKKANAILLRKIGVSEEDLRLRQLHHDDAIRQQRLNNDAAIHQLQLQHERAIRRMRSENDDAVQLMRSENDDAVQLMRSEYDETIRRLLSEHEATIRRLLSEHEATIRRLLSEHEANDRQMRSEHKANTLQIRSEHDTTVRRLQYDVCKYKLLISRLVKPKKGHKSKMCKHFDLMSNSANDCSKGSECTFAHNFFELMKDA